MFGYLAFVSLVLSVGAVLLIVGADPARAATEALARWLGGQVDHYGLQIVRALVIVAFNLVLSHLLVTTCHGLYYLIDRLYAKKPKILPKVR